MPRKNNHANPMHYLDFAFEQQNLAMAAAETIWHRTAQIALGKMSAIESASMWMEKPTAMVSGIEKATLAAIAGKSPAQVMQAAVAPMTAKASANAKRLRS